MKTHYHEKLVFYRGTDTQRITSAARNLQVKRNPKATKNQRSSRLRNKRGHTVTRG